MDFSKFTREELILAGVAVLLVLDLLFLPWFDITVGGLGLLTVSVTSPATGSPDGWLGVLAVLAAALVVLANRARAAEQGEPRVFTKT